MFSLGVALLSCCGAEFLLSSWLARFDGVKIQSTQSALLRHKAIGDMPVILLMASYKGVHRNPANAPPDPPRMQNTSIHRVWPRPGRALPHRLVMHGRRLSPLWCSAALSFRSPLTLAMIHWVVKPKTPEDIGVHAADPPSSSGAGSTLTLLAHAHVSQALLLTERQCPSGPAQCQRRWRGRQSPWPGCQRC